MAVFPDAAYIISVMHEKIFINYKHIFKKIFLVQMLNNYSCNYIILYNLHRRLVLIAICDANMTYKWKAWALIGNFIAHCSYINWDLYFLIDIIIVQTSTMKIKWRHFGLIMICNYSVKCKWIMLFNVLVIFSTCFASKHLCRFIHHIIS